MARRKRAVHPLHNCCGVQLHQVSLQSCTLMVQLCQQQSWSHGLLPPDSSAKLLLPLSSSHLLFFPMWRYPFCQFCKLNQFLIELKECQNWCRGGDGHFRLGGIGSGSVQLNSWWSAFSQKGEWWQSDKLLIQISLPCCLGEWSNHLSSSSLPSSGVFLSDVTVLSLLPFNLVFWRTYTFLSFTSRNRTSLFLKLCLIIAVYVKYYLCMWFEIKLWRKLNTLFTDLWMWLMERFASLLALYYWCVSEAVGWRVISTFEVFSDEDLKAVYI